MTSKNNKISITLTPDIEGILEEAKTMFCKSAEVDILYKLIATGLADVKENKNANSQEGIAQE